MHREIVWDTVGGLCRAEESKFNEGFIHITFGMVSKCSKTTPGPCSGKVEWKQSKTDPESELTVTCLDRAPVLKFTYRPSY